MPAKLPRFSVHHDGAKFVIFDLVDFKLEVNRFASRQAAEIECAARNGVVQPKTSEPSVLGILREKLNRRSVGITPEEAEGLGQPRVRDLRPQRPDQKAHIVATYRRLLPQALRVFANELAILTGLSEDHRRFRPIYAVVNEVIAAARRSLEDDEDLCDCLVPDKQPLQGNFRIDWWQYPRADHLGWLLLVHRLSLNPGRLKADYWHLSERDYYRKVAAALEFLALSFVVENDLDINSQWDLKLYDADLDFSSLGDEGDWQIGAEDRK
jgi:hypothetical protein